MHTSFPENSEIEYKNQVELILNRLGLTDLLRAEMEKIHDNFEPFCNKSFHQHSDNLNATAVPFDIVSQLVNQIPTQNKSNRVYEDAKNRTIHNKENETIEKYEKAETSILKKRKIDASILDEDSGFDSSNNSSSSSLNKIPRISLNDSKSSLNTTKNNNQSQPPLIPKSAYGPTQ